MENSREIQIGIGLIKNGLYWRSCGDYENWPNFKKIAGT